MEQHRKVKISAGIVTYNNIASIIECITLLLKHTAHDDFSLYIYDNHSSDTTVEMIKEKFPNVKVLCGSKNKGFGYGHNQILKKVHSDYHVIINPDIYLKTDVISQMAQYMEKHPDIVQLTPEIRNIDGSIQYLPKRDPSFKFVVLSKFKPFSHYRSVYTRSDEVISEPVRIASSTGCFSMVKTETMKKINGYDERFFLYFEDADLSRRLRKYGKIVYHPGMYVYHAWKRDNTRSLRGICIFLQSMLKYYVKWKKG